MRASRRSFLALGGAAALAGCGARNRKPEDDPPRGDLEVVDFALFLEYFEVDFYRRVADSGVLGGSEQRLLEKIGANEAEHVRVLERIARDLGGKPVERPRTDFSSVIRGGRGRVLRTAATLERTGASAYLAQAKRIQSTDVLAAALSIHTVEARHSATLDEIVGRPFLPDGAFAAPLEGEQVMARVERFLT